MPIVISACVGAGLKASAGCIIFSMSYAYITTMLRQGSLVLDDREYRNVNFTLSAGEVLGLAGLLGSGRTAVAKGIFGLVTPDSGSIEVDGRPLRIRSVADALAASIGYVPEDRLTEGLFLNFSISDNVVVRALDRVMSAAGWVTPSRKRNEAKRWIDRLAIKTGSPDLPVSSLSGGNQQRVVLAKWIASHPRVLILNRPTGVWMLARSRASMTSLSSWLQMGLASSSCPTTCQN
jgi:ABC-type sugar transport system ATPase subunit